MQTVNRLTQLFPLWAALSSIVAALWPSLFLPLKPYIIPMLGIIMFGMGVTLRLDDFKATWQRPDIISIGIFAQLLIMPLAAWLIAQSFNLSQELAIGLILLGCCPGGTASNVVCFLSKGDVALSITLTAISTLLALFTTPLLTWLYIGEVIEIPAFKMCLDILNVVALPVGLGILINHYLGHKFEAAKSIFPLLSVLAIVLIIAIIIALNHERLITIGYALPLCILLHNGIGLSGGYAISRLFGHSPKIARTIALEVGMQNSGLSVALALKYFGAQAALPGALFSIWHNVSGAILARAWSKKTDCHLPSS